MNWLRLWAIAGPLLGFYGGMAFWGYMCNRAGVRAGRGAGAKAVSGGIGDTGMGSPSDAVRLPDGVGGVA